MASAAPQHGRWHDDYASALSAAKSDRKPLLVVIHNPDQTRQALPQVARPTSESSSLLDNYHLCEVDVSTAQGRRVAKLFRPTAYPYTVITDRSADKIILRKAGEFSATEWSETLADYRRGTRPVSMAAFRAPASTFGASSSFGGPNCPT